MQSALRLPTSIKPAPKQKRGSQEAKSKNVEGCAHTATVQRKPKGTGAWTLSHGTTHTTTTKVGLPELCAARHEPADAAHTALPSQSVPPLGRAGRQALSKVQVGTATTRASSVRSRARVPT